MVIFHSYVNVYQRVIGNHQEEATFSQNSDFFKFSRSSDSGGWCAWLTYQTNMAHVFANSARAGCAPLVFVKVIWESQNWKNWMMNWMGKCSPETPTIQFIIQFHGKTHGKNMVKTHGEPTHGFPVFRFSQQNFHRSTPRIPSSADLGCQRQPRCWARERAHFDVEKPMVSLYGNPNYFYSGFSWIFHMEVSVYWRLPLGDWT